MPLREDFDVEFDNDAELLLADMEILPDDHPSERELKTQILRIYNAKLEEREKRKRFVIDRGLVDFKAAQAAERRRNKEERDLVARMRIFQRFQTAAEHDALVEGLLRARRLRKQIELYSHYRRMGVRTLEQARTYEQDRKRREGELKAKRQREDTPYLFAGTSHAASSSARGRGRSPRHGDVDLPGSGGGDSSGNGTDGGSSLNMNKGPGSELLSTRELELCQALPMLPLHFLAVKDTLVREAFRNGTLSEDGLRRTTNLPPAQVTTIVAIASASR
jgi:transcriptional adapter 2-alpha